MNEEQTTTMDDQMCRGTFSTQSIEKKVFYEKVGSTFSGMQDVLDRPLNTFTAENVREATEQLQTMLKALRRLPLETRQELVPSYDAVIGGVQNTLVELTLALDQLSPPEDKASFYIHILLSQEYFADIFAHDVSDASERVHAHTDPKATNILTFSARPRSLLDFSQTILPGMYDLIQHAGSVSLTQYEQAIVHLQTLDEVLEKQKKLLKGLQYIDNNEYTTLRCRLDVILAYASELLRQLVHSLATLQTHPRSKSRRSVQLREETRYSLTLFIHTFDDILQKTKELTLLQSQERFQHGKTDRATSGKIICLHGTDEVLIL